MLEHFLRLTTTLTHTPLTGNMGYMASRDPVSQSGTTTDGRHWAFAAMWRPSREGPTWQFAVADSADVAASVVVGIHDMTRWMHPDRIPIGVYWLLDQSDTQSWQKVLKWCLERYAVSLTIPAGYKQRMQRWSEHTEAQCLECGLVDYRPPWHAFPADRTGIAPNNHRRTHERLCVIAARMQTHVPVWGIARVTMGCKGYQFDLRHLVPAQPDSRGAAHCGGWITNQRGSARAAAVSSVSTVCPSSTSMATF